MNIELWKIATGSVIRDYRKKSNKTMLEAAIHCGHTKSWMSDIERGRNGIYYVDLVNLLKFYNTDVNAFDSKVKEVYADLVKLNFEE